LYLSDAKMQRQPSEAPVFQDEDVAVNIAARSSAAFDKRSKLSKTLPTRRRSVKMHSKG
jgi:hypothetical protein